MSEKLILEEVNENEVQTLDEMESDLKELEKYQRN